MSIGSHTSTIRVRVRDVAFDHVYFGVAFTWFEAGRGDFCRAAGVPYPTMIARGEGSYVTRAGASYRRPVPPTGVVKLSTRLVSSERARFAFGYEIAVDGADQPAVTGWTEHVMTGLTGRPRRIPDDFRAATVPTGESTPAPNIDGPADVHFAERLRVRYQETDAFGVVYYGNYFSWMEAAWSARLAGGPWDIAMGAPQGRTLAVVDAGCRYVSPARYDDVVRVEAGMSLVGRARLRLDYRFVREEPGPAQTLAYGFTLHAAAESGRVVRPPDELVRLLAGDTL